MSIFDDYIKEPAYVDLGDGSAIYCKVPTAIEIKPDFSFGAIDFLMPLRYGGMDVRRSGADRIIQISGEPLPRSLPGVEDMLADGWGWDEWRSVFGREGGTVTLARVQSGRYAHRLPTNRKRARARRKDLGGLP